jgi:hypothetical protein
MHLPNVEHLQVDREKVVGYLLAHSHPDGQAKAEFFRRFGFRLEQWDVLAEALRKHGKTYHITKTVESPHGTRYSVDGEIESPDGRNPRVRSVWILERDSTAPRLITAHPLEVPG